MSVLIDAFVRLIIHQLSFVSAQDPPEKQFQAVLKIVLLSPYLFDQSKFLRIVRLILSFFVSQTVAQRKAYLLSEI